MEIKAFDYNNPIHQKIGVLLTVMYWAHGDFKGIYDTVYEADEDNLYWQTWKEFLGEFPKSYPHSDKKNDKRMELWLNKECHRFMGIDFLSLNYTNKLQVEKGETYWDVDGGEYGGNDIDPAGGHGLPSHL